MGLLFRQSSLKTREKNRTVHSREEYIYGKSIKFDFKGEKLLDVRTCHADRSKVYSSLEKIRILLRTA